MGTLITPQGNWLMPETMMPDVSKDEGLHLIELSGEGVGVMSHLVG